ncbi:MAG: 16S rRNA processing protein RimM [Magnetococcales bacterium]|nr:16S rRNA processing protein RimM [Magnetococcales bacterium]
MTGEATRWVALGRIQGAFGVRGELRVVPYALEIARLLPDPAPEVPFPLTLLLEFPFWRLGREAPGAMEYQCLAGRLAGDKILASLRGFTSREEIQTLTGTQIWLPWHTLPGLAANHYYWLQLQGLRVLEAAGPEVPQPRALGVVTGLFATGSNDVLRVGTGDEERDDDERLLPFIHDTILEVDLDAGLIRVQLMPGL